MTEKQRRMNDADADNPITRSEMSLPMPVMAGELVFAWFYLTRDKPFNIHLRAVADAAVKFRELKPEVRAEILHCMDRLFEDFKELLSEGNYIDTDDYSHDK